MFNTFGTSWSLIKSSAKVLQADKELVIFPIISGIAGLLLSAAFFVPMLMGGFFNTLTQQGPKFIDYVILFFFYLLQYFIVFFSNTALVGAAMIRIRGGDPTVRDGLKIAFDRFVTIFFYSLIAATVGLLLSMIKNKGNVITKIVVSIVGFVWNVATFLVVPVLAVEDVGPLEAIKRSVNYLKKTWGEQLVGSFSISALFNLVIFVLILLAAATIVLLINAGAAAWLIATVGVLTVMLIGLISLISSTFNGIYTSAVYQFATTGEAGTYFDPIVVRDAFHPSNSKF